MNSNAINSHDFNGTGEKELPSGRIWQSIRGRTKLLTATAEVETYNNETLNILPLQ
jgi:hypothetical protein